MLRYSVLALAVVVAVSGPAFPADSAIRQIEIKSSWGGLGRPQKTELVLRYDNGEYRIGSKRIDPAEVESLLASIQQPPQTKPTLENLGMTDEWLTNAVDKLEKRSGLSSPFPEKLAHERIRAGSAHTDMLVFSYTRRHVDESGCDQPDRAAHAACMGVADSKLAR